RLGEILADIADGLGAERPAAVARELTKLFEETRQAPLGELANYYRDKTVKGEIVVLVGSADETAIEVIDIDGLLKQALKTQSLRDAVADVSDMTGAKKNEVYQRALKLKKE